MIRVVSRDPHSVIFSLRLMIDLQCHSDDKGLLGDDKGLGSDLTDWPTVMTARTSSQLLTRATAS